MAYTRIVGSNPTVSARNNCFREAFNNHKTR
jgi:hypothetical protein